MKKLPISFGLTNLEQQCIIVQNRTIEEGVKNCLIERIQSANNVLSGLTEEEKHICISVFRKICKNADMLLKKNME